MTELSPENEKLLDKFSTLSFDDMKRKLKAFSERIDHNYLPILDEVAQSLENNPLIDEWFCKEVYKEILKFMENIENLSKEKIEEESKKINNKLKEMLKREEEERREENPDALLENL